MLKKAKSLRKFLGVHIWRKSLTHLSMFLRSDEADITFSSMVNVFSSTSGYVGFPVDYKHAGKEYVFWDLGGSVANPPLISAVAAFVFPWLAFSRCVTISQLFPFLIGVAQLGTLISRLLRPRTRKLESIMELDKAQDILLSDIVIKELQADLRTRSIISQYLYAEKLLADSSTEVKWRCRCFSGSIPVDSVVYSVDFLRDDDEESQRTEEISRSTDLEEVADPFKHIFGI